MTRRTIATSLGLGMKYRVANKSGNTGKYIIHVISHVIHDKTILTVYLTFM